MNKRERKALDIYMRNNEYVELNTELTWRELLLIAKQQDTLYLMAHSRADKRLLGDL